MFKSSRLPLQASHHSESAMRAALLKALAKRAARPSCPSETVIIPAGHVTVDEVRQVLRAIERARAAGGR